MPDTNRGPLIISSCVTVVSLAFVAVALRIYVRVCMIRSLGYDDFVILLAMVRAVNSPSQFPLADQLGPLHHRPWFNLRRGQEWSGSSCSLPLARKYLHWSDVQLYHSATVPMVHHLRKDLHRPVLATVDSEQTLSLVPVDLHWFSDILYRRLLLDYRLAMPPSSSSLGSNC